MDLNEIESALKQAQKSLRDGQSVKIENSKITFNDKHRNVKCYNSSEIAFRLAWPDRIKKVSGTYFCEIIQEKAGYRVHFPDYPGAMTFGSSIEEARIMASEALSGCLEPGRRPASAAGSFRGGGLPDRPPARRTLHR